MQVVVMGASGFVGQEVVRQAMAREYEVFPVVRDHSLPVFVQEGDGNAPVTPVPWGADPDVLRDGFGIQPGAWIVNAAGLPKERRGEEPHKVHEAIAQEALKLAEGLEARRLVHLSPLLVPTQDGFIHSKQAAEALIATAKVPWSILRSAPAFGPGDEFLDEIGAWMVRSPFIPRFLEDVPLEPLWVGDLAQALLSAEKGIREVGDGRIRWGDLLAQCAEAAGKKLLGPVLSDDLVLRLTRTLGDRGLLMGLVPFTEAGFRRHQRGYLVQDNALEALLGRPPRSLEDYLRTEWPYRHGEAAPTPEGAGAAPTSGSGPDREA